MIFVSRNESIYHIMYSWGLKHISIEEIEAECAAVGKDIRPKDYQNYWNGYHRSDLYRGPGSEDIFKLSRRVPKEVGSSSQFFDLDYWQYPVHPYDSGIPEVQNRWVPCNKDNKPMIRWGEGCMSLADAVAYKDQVYLAENLKGTRFIVIDCDGNHGDEIDMETVYFLNRWRGHTHCLVKPECENEGVPLSFHLTFKVDRIIPTMHFPYAHIDIVGNRRNSLRYWKNKEWNHMEPIEMSGARWTELQDYLKYRKEKADAQRDELARHADCCGSQADDDQTGIR